MKKRNPLAVFGLSIITFGLYDIYWLVTTKKVLNKETRQHTPSFFLFLVLPYLLVIVGFIVTIVTAAHSVSSVNTNNQFNSNFNNQGFNNSTTTVNGSPAIIGVIILVLGSILSFFLSIYWYFKFSKAVNEYTQGKMSTAVSFLTLIVVHLIGVALIQDAFNDLNDPFGNSPNPVTAAPVNPGFGPTDTNVAGSVAPVVIGAQPQPTVLTPDMSNLESSAPQPQIMSLPEQPKPVDTQPATPDIIVPAPAETIQPSQPPMISTNHHGQATESSENKTDSSSDGESPTQGAAV